MLPLKKMMMTKLRCISVLAVSCCVFGVACTRAPLKDASQALRLTSAPRITDDLPLEPLLAAAEKEADFLEKNAGCERFVFGERVIAKAEYVAGLRHFAQLGRVAADTREFFESVKRDFDFYEIYGDKSWGEAFITAYYEPVVPGALKKTARFSRPLYAQPDDLLAVDLALFDAEKYALDRKWRGRLDGKKVVPYYTREAIDSKDALAGRGLELVWVDPLDAFMIQIQGSATIDLGDGKAMRVGFAEKNGRNYEPLGKFLRDLIPKEQMSLQSIEVAMRALPLERQQALMNKNPSYVFFKNMPEGGTTSLGIPPTAGRTVAVDQRFFPKGALAFLDTEKPKWASPEEASPKEYEKLARFVLDQDVGGAITGGGRLDLYWGSGDEAKRFAGAMKQRGRLYYLAPKTANNGAKR